MIIEWLLAATTAVGAATAEPVYEVALGAGQRTLSVVHCRTPSMPHRFALESTTQLKALGDVRYAGRRLDVSDGHVVVPAGSAGCLEYRLALDRLREERRASVLRLERDLIATPDVWLFAPEPTTPYQVRFALPPGIQVSAPWKPLDESLTRYRVTPSPTGWQPVVAFGRFQQFAVALPGGRLDVAVLDGSPAADVAEVKRWLSAAADHVVLTYGRFPVPRVQVIVVPVAGLETWGGRATDEPMPFARVLRRGGIAAQFFLNQLAPLDAVLDDWTATHEFSHLLLPYVRREDAWLSEGFASYYQNVLRARSGVLDEATAWSELLAGFDRGRDDYRDTLAESIRFRGPNMIMRMYWSGAAIALLADVELRARSGGAQSLDSVLAALDSCCLPSARTWTAVELFDRLDRLSSDTVFAELYRRWVNAVEFPDVGPVLEELGVESTANGIVLAPAPASSVRRAIMARRTD